MMGDLGSTLTMSQQQQFAETADYFNAAAGGDFHMRNDGSLGLFSPLQPDGSQTVVPLSTPQQTPLGHGGVLPPASHPHLQPQTGSRQQQEQRSYAGGRAEENEEPVTVSISTAFHPGSNHDPAPADLVVVSTDNVFFYVHAHRLLSASSNAFSHLLAGSVAHGHAISPGGEMSHGVVSAPSSAAVLNVILHTAYGLSCETYRPPFEDLSAAISALPTYGIDVGPHLAPAGHLYPLILALAPLHPIEVYAIAAESGAHDLAVTCSPHLISFNLATLTDQLAARIGPLYLKKLFFLHLGRTEALKRLLLPTPYPHPETRTCSFEEQRKLTRAWAMATAALAWEARPDISDMMISAALSPLGDGTCCQVCKEGLAKKVNDLVVQWNCIKRTI